MLMRRSLRLVLCGSFLATTAGAQEPDHSAHNPALVLGSVNFRNSGNPAAQAPLQRGVAWLHNFKYNEAADAFRAAQRADTSLALHQASVAAIFGGKDRAPARAAAKRFREIADTLPPDAQRTNLKRVADQIDALIAGADGDLPREIAMLRALALPAAASASTPPIYIPMHELLGDALLRANQPVEAAAAFRSALVARPNRSRALLGLARSLSASGDRVGAEAAYDRLADNWKRADSRALQLLRATNGRR